MAPNTTATLMTIEPVTCDQAQLLLSRGLECDLSHAETCVMYAHLAHCDGCRQAMGELAALDASLKALKQHYEEATLGPDFTANLMHQLDPQSGKQQKASLTDQLHRFGRDVAQDPKLRLQLGEAANETAFVALYVQLGQASGYQFQATQVAELLHTAAANDELSDSQLDQVAAAGSTFSSQKMFELLGVWMPP